MKIFYHIWIGLNLALYVILGGCPQAPESRQSPHLSHSVVVNEETGLDIPCSIDLSSLITKERMERFEPSLQKLLYIAERKICHFYERLLIERPATEKLRGDFPNKYLPLDEYVAIRKKLENASYIQQAVSGDLVDTIYLVLKAQHPHSTCPENAKKVLQRVLLSERSDIKASGILIQFNNSNENCHVFFGYNTIETSLFQITHGYVGPCLVDHKNCE